MGESIKNGEDKIEIMKKRWGGKPMKPTVMEQIRNEITLGK